jgi:UDP-N-acetyl-D-mannosaminuronic acid dehydrogenase
MKLSVFGLGYIGLPTAAVLASHKHEVIGIDVDNEIVDLLNQGQTRVNEPGLDNLVYDSVKSGFLKASLTPEKAEVFIIAVPTPIDNKKKPDLSFVKAAAKQIAPLLEKGNIIILESTSPVGTTERLVEWFREVRDDLRFPSFENEQSVYDISIAYCPERVLPGRILHEIVNNERVIGGINRRCANDACGIYKIFVEAECLLTDCRTAELTKLTENSYRDVNIAFANELSMICDGLNIDVWNLIRFANMHPRVNILEPGAGVGGHCIAVDPWLIVDTAPVETELIRTARNVNDSKPCFVVKKVSHAIELATRKKSAKPIITTLGLSFKPDVDDLRESPALEISRQINKMEIAKHYVVEPNIRLLPVGFENNAGELVDLEFALTMSDIIVLLVDHKSFKEVASHLLAEKVIVDVKGIFSSSAL